MYRYDTLLCTPHNQLYTYLSPAPLELGTIVQVPFGQRLAKGVVWAETPPNYAPEFKLKSIQNTWPLPPISTQTRNLIDWTATYYMAPRGNCLKMVLTGLADLDYTPRKTYAPFPIIENVPREFPLTPDQLSAAKLIQSAIQANTFSSFLLDGVTGSGKTEVYYEALLSAIQQKQQVLILLPEITLTQQWLERFKHRFGVLPTRWHSSLKLTERRHNWQEILSGNASVIVGARSALFLPFQRLGLIVVDEEHDGSYKQEDGIHYHARDLAVVRAKLETCPVVLASATPSIETYRNATSEKYQHLILSQRFGSAGTPTSYIIDLRKPSEEVRNGQYVSKTLKTAIEETLKRKEQVILFLNRRGFAPITLCISCGHKLACSNCAAHMVQHKTTHGVRLQCHHCGKLEPLGNACPECDAESTLREWGVGIDRLHNEVKEKFLTARTLAVSSDHMTSQSDLDNLYTALHNHEVDIIIGTQMMAKGHDFSNVTLVGIIDADSTLMTEDIRAAENTYQLLHQVAGRCGRGDKAGHVYIQTFSPDHTVIQALKTFDRDAFLELELNNRSLGNLPPYSRQASLVISSASEESVKKISRQLLQSQPVNPDIMILGPAPAPLYKLRGNYRYRFLLQSSKATFLQPYLQSWTSELNLASNTRLTIDIDPLTLL